MGVIMVYKPTYNWGPHPVIYLSIVYIYIYMCVTWFSLVADVGMRQNIAKLVKPKNDGWIPALPSFRSPKPGSVDPRVDPKPCGTSIFRPTFIANHHWIINHTSTPKWLNRPTLTAFLAEWRSQVLCGLAHSQEWSLYLLCKWSNYVPFRNDV
jgi:hypothetical protein